MVEPSGSLRTMTYMVVGFCSFIVAALVLSWSTDTEIRNNRRLFTSPQEVTDLSFDAILVLGGGRPEAWNLPPAYVQTRCDDALAIVERKPDIPILCLSAGTAHLPLLYHQERPVYESVASAAYIKERNSKVRTMVETTSFDTIGNAFFARTGFVDPAGWRRLLIVTNEFHMNRTRAIFEWIFPKYDLYYLASANEGLSEKAVEARRQKEHAGLKSVETLARKYPTLSETWKFLTTKHDLYTATSLVKKLVEKNGSSLDKDMLKSYGG